MNKHRSPLRVLVVDDNRDAADSLGLLVRLWGHEARVAYDGPSGLAAALEFRPDAALLDVMMPGGMHGGQLAEALRHTPGVEGALLVAVSGAAPEAIGEQAGLFDRYLRKPCDTDELEALLRAHSRARPEARRLQRSP
jgi:DNA-binding response OmpR family regulator